MSQSDTPAVSGTTAGSIHQKIDDVREILESLNVKSMSDTEIVVLRESLKSLEDEVGETRKETVDGEIKERVPVGESLRGLSHIGSHNKYLKENDATVVMRAVSKGIDYTEFVQVNANALAKQYPGLAEIGEAEYTYVR